MAAALAEELTRGLDWGSPEKGARSREGWGHRAVLFIASVASLVLGRPLRWRGPQGVAADDSAPGKGPGGVREARQQLEDLMAALDVASLFRLVARDAAPQDSDHVERRRLLSKPGVPLGSESQPHPHRNQHGSCLGYPPGGSRARWAILPA
jgi:hypothetical protein